VNLFVFSLIHAKLTSIKNALYLYIVFECSESFSMNSFYWYERKEPKIYWTYSKPYNNGAGNDPIKFSVRRYVYEKTGFKKG
jgi:hypothetical protein